MSAPDIKISYAELAELEERLNKALSAFAGANEVAASLSASVGHPRLASKVHGFASKWSIRRGRLEESLTLLRDCATAIRDTFGEVDRELGAQLEQAARDAAYSAARSQASASRKPAQGGDRG